jgi:MFS family permease
MICDSEQAWRRNERVVVSTVALHAAAVAGTVPIIPLFVQELGADSLQSASVWSGLILTSSPFFAAILAPVWGALADRFGLKAMVQRAQLATIVALAGMAVAGSIPQLLLFRIGLGILGGYGAMSVALVASSVPEGEAAPAIGRLQAGRIFGLGFGPLLGGVVVAAFNSRAVFVASALVAAVNLALITWLYDTPLTERDWAPASSQDSQFSFRHANRVPNYLAVLAVLFLVRFSERTFDPIIPLAITVLLHNSEAVPIVAGLVVSLGALASALSAHLSGQLTHRFRPRQLLLLSLGGGVVCALLLAGSGSVYALGVWRLGLGLLAGSALSLGYGVASFSVPLEGRASAYGLLSSGALLGGAIAPLFAGLLAAIGLRAAFVLSAVVYAAAGLTTIVGVRHAWADSQ